MEFLPTVTRAEYRGGYRLHVTFNDGRSGTIDFLQWLEGPIFEPLKDPEYFQRFFLDGGSVVAERCGHRARDSLCAGKAERGCLASPCSRPAPPAADGQR